MKAKATVRLRFPSRENLQIVLNSITPEAKSPASNRAQTSLMKEDNVLVLRVEADDTVALRASLNAYLRWISSVLNVLEVLEAQ